MNALLRATLLAVCAALAACGQSGALYLPDRTPVPGTQSVQPPVAPAETERKKDEDEQTPAAAPPSSTPAPTP